MVWWRGLLVGVIWTCLAVSVWHLYFWVPGQPTVSTVNLTSDSSHLIDLPFSFLSDHSCNSSSTVPIVVLVHSAPNNVYNRQVIRDTWGKHLTVYFLLGESTANLDHEDRIYGDLLRGSFMDSYRNLTYKHVMGLLWASTRCSSAQYVVKTDDDVYVNTEMLQQWLLKKETREEHFLACPLSYDTWVHRSYRSKWRVTPAEYPDRYYPSYCLGWAVIYSISTTSALYQQAQKTPYFWIDDVYVTGILAAKANVTHVPLESLAHVLSDSVPSHFIFLLTSPDKFHNIDHHIHYSNLLH